MRDIATKDTPVGSLTVLQIAWAKHYLRTGNATEAARLAGYTGDKHTLDQIGYTNLKRVDFAFLMELAGITDSELIKKTREGLEAKQGRQPLYNIRHKYLETSLKLKKRLQNEPEQPGVAIQINLVTGGYVPRPIEDEAAPDRGYSGPTQVQSAGVAQESQENDNSDNGSDTPGPTT